MNGEEAAELIAAIAGPLFLFILVVLTWRALRARKRSVPMVEDGPEDEPYRVYTRAYDLEISAAQVKATLPRASRDVDKGWYQRDHALWLPCIPRVEVLLAEPDAWDDAFERLLAAVPGFDPRDMVVVVLIDQSGSMQGARMAWAAVIAARVTEMLAKLGAKSEVLGFSTAGWHGGFAYADWCDAGRPPRPGRLCALLHLIYKSADETTLTVEARNAMLDPALLRENIDGEALEWARSRLAARPERHRILLVISDGAPVDDATLMHNGPNFLSRHLAAVIADIKAENRIVLAGLGIEHRVETFYPHAETIEAQEDLARATVAVLEKAFGEACAR